MSCDSKDREFSIVIDINENYESYRNLRRAIKMNLRISLFYFILLGMIMDFIQN